MWRWLLPYGLTAIPVTTLVVTEQLWVPRSDLMDGGDHYRVGTVTLIWLLLMLRASPTILYYRLLVFAGERAVPRRPRTGVAALLLLCGLAPPLVQNWLVSRASLARDFTGPAPDRADNVVIADRHGPVDRNHCSQACARLLFGRGARRVLMAKPGTEGVVPALYVEQRPTCPPVRQHYGAGESLPDTPTVSVDFPDRETGARVLAQIASGRCPAVRSARTNEAGLLLGEGWVLRDQPVPDGFGLINGDFRFVERRENGRWVRLSQRMGQSLTFRWLYPFAFLPGQDGWIAGQRRSTFVPDSVPSSPQPWGWAGVTLPEVPDLGWQRVREMLQAAVTLPASAPRDARHQLARQYLALLDRRTPDAVDHALVRRLPADPRVDKDDLRNLARVEAMLRGETSHPRIPDSDGAAWADQDLGFFGTRKHAALAFDAAMLLALHLIAFFIMRQAFQARRQKAPAALDNTGQTAS